MPVRTDDPTALDTADTLIRAVIRAISGVRVGIVDTYDPVQRVANVQPVRRFRRLGQIFSKPQVVQAPVGWWRFGGMVLAGELEKGDEVLLVTCEREIRPWFIGGAEHDPVDTRMHDPTDTVVLPWISSVGRAITARTPRNFLIGREDGTAGIQIPMDIPARIVVDGGPLGIVMGSGATSPLVKFTPYAAAWTAFTSTIAAAFATWGATVPPTAISNGVFIAALGPAIAALGAAVAAQTTVKLIGE